MFRVFASFMSSQSRFEAQPLPKNEQNGDKTWVSGDPVAAKKAGIIRPVMDYGMTAKIWSLFVFFSFLLILGERGISFYKKRLGS